MSLEQFKVIILGLTCLIFTFAAVGFAAIGRTDVAFCFGIGTVIIAAFFRDL